MLLKDFFSLLCRGAGLTLLCTLFLVTFPSKSFAQTNESTLRLVVISEDDGIPVIGANIILTGPQGDTLHTGVTNVDGFKEFSDIEPLTYQIRISYIGYETLLETLTLQPGETRIFRPALRTATAELEEVVVGVSRGAVRREAGMQTISAEDLDLVPAPGPGGDLSAYLQTLPSVVTTGDRGGELFIRGGTPAQNLILVDNMPIVKPFHISNLFSAFPQDFISSVDMYAGGFGAEYTGATSSVLDVNLRQGNMRRFKSKAAISPYLGLFQIEGPLKRDEQSIFVIGRHSAIQETGPTLTGREVPIRFYDMLARYSVNWPGFTCSFTGLITHDEGQINPKRNVQLSWNNSAAGVRCLGYREELSHPIDMTFGWSGFNSSETGVDETGRSSGVNTGFFRFDNGGEMFGVPVDYGFNWNLTKYSSKLDDPFPELTGSPIRFADLDSSIDEFISLFSVYISMRWEPSEHFVISPGLTSQNRHTDMKVTLEPRLRVTWKPDGTDNQEVSLAAGKYIQMREGITDERDAGTVFYVYKPLGEQDPLPKAYHGILGYRMKISESLEFNLEGYVKQQTNIPVAEWTREPGNTVRTASADGFTYGLDFQVEFNKYPFYLTAGYGLSEVTYEASTDELVAWLDSDIFRYNPSHDRRHLFNVVASYEIADFTLNANWRYNSGGPFTKIYAFDLALRDLPDQDPLEDAGTAQTLYSEPFDGEFPSFHRLDVSLNREFRVSSGFSFETEVGAINAYNVKNPFYFDVNTLQQVNQTPILPYISITTIFN